MYFEFLKCLLHVDHTGGKRQPPTLRRRYILCWCCERLDKISHPLSERLAPLGIMGDQLRVYDSTVMYRRFLRGPHLVPHDAERRLWSARNNTNFVVFASRVLQLPPDGAYDSINPSRAP